jgi:hypothetical protein
MNRNPYEPHVGQQVIVGHCSRDKETTAEVTSVIGRNGDVWRVTVKNDVGESEADWYLSEQITDHLVLRYGEVWAYPADMAKPNLKLLLMQLGNKLVTEHGFQPSNHMTAQRVLVGVGENHTTMIHAFTEWLNRVPEGQEVLKEMGIAWPVVERPSHGRK